MKVFRDEKITGENHFTVGMDADLDDEIIDSAGLREPLEKFGKELLKQYKKNKRYRGGESNDIIGVQFNTIGVTFILKD